MGFLLGLVYIVIAAVSLILIGLILIQDSKAGGLSAAIAGGGDSFVGAAANKGITKLTAGLAAAFILLCLFAGILHQKDKNSSLVTEDFRAREIGPGPDGSGDSTDTSGNSGGSTEGGVVIPPSGTGEVTPPSGTDGGTDTGSDAGGSGDNSPPSGDTGSGDTGAGSPGEPGTSGGN